MCVESECCPVGAYVTGYWNRYWLVINVPGRHKDLRTRHSVPTDWKSFCAWATSHQLTASFGWRRSVFQRRRTNHRRELRTRPRQDKAMTQNVTQYGAQVALWPPRRPFVRPTLAGMIEHHEVTKKLGFPVGPRCIGGHNCMYLPVPLLPGRAACPSLPLCCSFPSSHGEGECVTAVTGGTWDKKDENGDPEIWKVRYVRKVFPRIVFLP